MAFDEAYERWRGELFVALTLATGSRDVAADAVDEGYTKWSATVLRRRLPAPEQAAIAAAALRRARKAVDGSEPGNEGFRLRREPLADAHRETLAGFRAAPASDRLAVALALHEGWEPSVVAAATGIDAAGVTAAIGRVATDLGVDTDTARLRLSEAFSAEASSLREPLERASSVRSMGITRRVLKVAGGVAALVVGVAGVTALVSAIGSPEGDISAATSTLAPGETLPPVTGDPSLEKATLAWTQSGLPIQGQGDVRTVTPLGDKILMLGQEWGAGIGRPVLATSGDGIDWELLGFPFVGEGDVGSAAVVDGQIFIAGNTFGAFGSQMGVWSSPNGLDWSALGVPVEAERTIAGQPVRTSQWVERVFALGDALALSVRENAEFDDRLLQLLVPEHAVGNGWGTGQDGITIYGRNGGEVAFVEWADLGLEPEEVALLSGAPSLLVSIDGGETWERRVVPRFDGLFANAHAGDVDVVLTSGRFGYTLWKIGDEWAEVDTPFSPTGLADFAGQIYVAGFDDAGRAGVWRTSDLSTWELVLDGGPGQGIQLASTSSSLVGVGASFFPQPVDLDIDGWVVRVFQTGGLKVIDPTTEEVVAELGFERIFNGGGGFTVDDPETGEPLLELTPADIEGALNRGPDFVQELPSVYVTRDGLSWRQIDVASDLPTRLQVYNAIGIGDSVLLLGWDELGGGQQLWVGSPA